MVNKKSEKKSNVKKVKNGGRGKFWLVIFFVLLIVAIAFGVLTFFPCEKGLNYSVKARRIRRINSNLKVENYKIMSADGKKQKALLKLEVADNDEARLIGLMNRKEVPANTGMIFDFGKPDYYSMWMKDTRVPLDMIFMNDDGVVMALATDREPLTEDYINPCNLKYEEIVAQHSDDENWDIDGFFDECEAKYSTPEKATRYVIEVPAGTIKKAGIELGDKLLK